MHSAVEKLSVEGQKIKNIKLKMKPHINWIRLYVIICDHVMQQSNRRQMFSLILMEIYFYFLYRWLQEKSSIFHLFDLQTEQKTCVSVDPEILVQIDHT